MMAVDGKRRDLYSLDRNIEFEKIRSILTKSSVLQKGEYNLTPTHLGRGIWDTCNSRDFNVSLFIYLYVFFSSYIVTKDH